MTEQLVAAAMERWSKCQDTELLRWTTVIEEQALASLGAKLQDMQTALGVMRQLQVEEDLIAPKTVSSAHKLTARVAALAELTLSQA